MSRGEKMTEKNVKQKFEKRVNAAARAISSVGKCRAWGPLGLTPASIAKALDHLVKMIEDARTGTTNGFKL